MRNNETGEFELVVGNRQLLSGFFIVVLLFAVGVALGYILGQNSEKALKATDAASTIPQTAQNRPQPASPAESAPSQTAAQPAAQPAAPSDSAPAAEASGPTTQPARDAVPPSAVPPSAAPPAAAPAAAPLSAEPAAGTYWQVMALAHSDADVLVRSLKEKGFPAVTSPGTKGLTRVLVGPYPDRQALSRAKSDLEAAGMPAPYRVEVGGDPGHK